MAFQNYFSKLFSSAGPSSQEIEQCVSKIQLRVSEEMNAALTKPFTCPEVEAALHQMGPLKSPGLDNFGAEFYQKHWATISSDVSNVVLKLLNGEGMVSSFNSTFIELIPKKQCAKSVVDYKLISLCNIFYKLL